MKKVPPASFGVHGGGDDDGGGIGAFAEKGGVGPVLGDDDALVVGAGGDVEEEAGGAAVFAGLGAGLGCVIHGHLDGGEVVGASWCCRARRGRRGRGHPVRA